MSASHPKPEIPVLLICHRCRLVHDESGGWMTKTTYREATRIDPVTCRLKHTDWELSLCLKWPEQWEDLSPWVTRLLSPTPRTSP
jgi:hypothetical protein